MREKAPDICGYCHIVATRTSHGDEKGLCTRCGHPATATDVAVDSNEFSATNDAMRRLTGAPISDFELCLMIFRDWRKLDPKEDFWKMCLWVAQNAQGTTHVGVTTFTLGRHLAEVRRERLVKLLAQRISEKGYDAVEGMLGMTEPEEGKT